MDNSVNLLEAKKLGKLRFYMWDEEPFQVISVWFAGQATARVLTEVAVSASRHNPSDPIGAVRDVLVRKGFKVEVREDDLGEFDTD